MPRLLEQLVPARFGLAQLLRSLALGIGEQLARLVAGDAEDLLALALGLLAEALDFDRAGGHLLLARPYLLFGPR